MIPPLVRLPTTVVDHRSIDVLARCVEALAVGTIVLIGPQHGATGDELDEFTIASAISARCPGAALGIAARVGAGRTPSIVAREATAAQLLGACEALLLDGTASDCRDAARIVSALFSEGSHTVTTPSALVVGARNLPLPDIEGGPPTCWRDGTRLIQLIDGEPVVCGSVVECRADDVWPAPEPGVLVVVEHPLGTPDALAAVLAR